MKKLFLLSLLILNISCQEILEGMICGMPPEHESIKAKWYFANTSISKVNMSDEEIKEYFGCYHYFGDYVYSFSTMFDSGYILVRGGEAVYYVKKNDAIEKKKNEEKKPSPYTEVEVRPNTNNQDQNIPSQPISQPINNQASQEPIDYQNQPPSQYQVNEEYQFNGYQNPYNAN